MVICLSVGLTGCGKNDESENSSSEVMLDFNPILSCFRVAVTSIDEDSFEGKVYLISNETNVKSPEVPFALGDTVKINCEKLYDGDSEVTGENRVKLNDIEELSVVVDMTELVQNDDGSYTAHEAFFSASSPVDSEAVEEWTKKAAENDGLFFYDTSIKY